MADGDSECRTAPASTPDGRTGALKAIGDADAGDADVALAAGNEQVPHVLDRTGHDGQEQAVVGDSKLGFGDTHGCGGDGHERQDGHPTGPLIKGIVRVGAMMQPRDQFAVYENPELYGLLNLSPLPPDAVIEADRGAEITFLDAGGRASPARRGVVLESARIGGTVVTSAEAVMRFLQALNTPIGKATILPAERQRAISVADRKLDQAGIY